MTDGEERQQCKIACERSTQGSLLCHGIQRRPQKSKQARRKARKSPRSSRTPRSCGSPRAPGRGGRGMRSAAKPRHGLGWMLEERSLQAPRKRGRRRRRREENQPVATVPVLPRGYCTVYEFLRATAADLTQVRAGKESRSQAWPDSGSLGRPVCCVSKRSWLPVLVSFPDPHRRPYQCARQLLRPHHCHVSD